MNKLILFTLLFVHLCMSAQVLDSDGIPQKPSPPRLVNDYAELFSITEREELEQKLVAFNDSKSTQICVVTVDDIGDYEISDYALRLGRNWGIGQKDKDNGVLIVVAKETRKVTIELGYGIESFITDYDSKEIIDDLIIPSFKQSNYYEGIKKATDRIINQLQGTYYASPAAASEEIPAWVIILIIVVIVLIIFTAISSGNGSVTVSGGGWSWSSGGGGGGGGSSWSGGGSSGGFGGFGGGSFGGGGSSGSW